MDKFLIDLKTLNDVVSYLGTRPYTEVFQIVQSIQSQVETQIKGAKNGGEMDSKGDL